MYRYPSKDIFKIQWGDDFGSPEETHIANQYDCPVIVHRFPSDIKAFYMKRPENEKVVLGMDILALKVMAKLWVAQKKQI